MFIFDSNEVFVFMRIPYLIKSSALPTIGLCFFFFKVVLEKDALAWLVTNTHCALNILDFWQFIWYPQYFSDTHKLM